MISESEQDDFNRSVAEMMGLVPPRRTSLIKGIAGIFGVVTFTTLALIGLIAVVGLIVELVKS